MTAATETVEPRTLADRIHLDEISYRARHASPGRAAMAIGNAPFFAAGYAARYVLAGLWACVSWPVSAVMRGWQHAGPQPDLPSKQILAAENEMLREQLARIRGGS